jgi:uncharacterized protein
MECRPNCGACCIAPTITSKLPNMPEGKPSGIYCVNLDPESLSCNVWGTEDYPKFCADYQPCEAVCGKSKAEAMTNIYHLDEITTP